ncbi:hypothetical protein EV182_002927 [Spiromyces aspiralis]|uniref:Uncharacterized protein n=1 Tax=Spiromyces aspiralis TaxID=68401 RepID=A0ACC1HDH8_9FUNG|nr:hypothetical protein EV182_002927 [Spiromyces aspiralis]
MQQGTASLELSRLAQFASDCMSVGCLRGFASFEVEVRSREELILRIRQLKKGDDATEREECNAGSGKRQPTSTLPILRYVEGVECHDETKLLIAKVGDEMAATPKLSDADLERDKSHISFLIGCYPRYRCPYVWLRSDHRVLIEAGENHPMDLNAPIDLESMKYWRQYDIRPWDVLAEILTNTKLRSANDNPFKIDYEYFERIPVEESTVAIGAMLDFLRKVYLRHYVFSDIVMDDIIWLQFRHFQLINSIRERSTRVQQRENMA